jgi:3-oxoacyl-[acyl-carrier protein] reductase
MSDFKGKKAIITGASRGIGLAIAEAFVKAGADVAICAVNEDALAKAGEKLRKLNTSVKVLARKADVSNANDIESFIENTVKEFGAIDILVNNAGITRDSLLVRMSEDDWDKVMSVNLKGAFLMSKAALKIMMKARSGSVVNITSVVGQCGNAGQANYSASKAGIIGLTKSLAKEFASRKVRVNAVAPGFVSTEMTDKLSGEIKEEVLKTVPLKRFANAQDIACAVLFLAGEESSYITGQTLAVNGGLYI